MSEIQKTINYFQFKTIKSNRPIDPQHVSRLVEKIRKKNLLHLCPIIVNSAMEVIEGQHRLEAAKKLETYIYYQVDDGVGKGDIAGINSGNKNWSINDYINYWLVEGRDGFELFGQFMIDNPQIPPSTVQMLLSKNQNRNMRFIQEGNIDVSNLDYALKVAEAVKEYADLIDFAYSRNFVLAIMRCFNTTGYDHAHMQSKLEYQSRSLRRCVNTKQYCEMLSEIYNHSMSAKNHLTIQY